MDRFTIIHLNGGIVIKVNGHMIGMTMEDQLGPERYATYLDALREYARCAGYDLEETTEY